MSSKNRKARRTPSDSAEKSFLAGLHSLSAVQFSWIREAPRRGEAVVCSMLASLYSLAAVRFPRLRNTPRYGELRTTIMTALAHIDHYEDRNTRRPATPDALGAQPVGLSYREIQMRVQSEFPGRSISIMTIRSYARDAKQEGRTMPYRRPNSKRRRKAELRRWDP